MDNLKLVVTGNNEQNRKMLECFFIDRFSGPIASISNNAFVLIYQRDQIPKNQYNAKIYCNGDEKIHTEIFRLLIQSGINIKVDDFV